MKNRISMFLATACFIGKIPGAPGTYAAVATTLVYFLIWRVRHQILPELHVSAIGLITLVGVFVSANVSRAVGKEDPNFVVIDEVAGQLLSLLFLPVTLVNIIGATLLFRVFDIWKPFPIRRLERLENGVGVMADDLLAGVYANVLLQIAGLLAPR
jgi:phosphatidylglycerophosphatase A